MTAPTTISANDVTSRNAVSRSSVPDTIGSRSRFLLYLIGPYKSFNLNYIRSEAEREAIDTEELPELIRRLFTNIETITDAQAFLRRIQGQLRETSGVNAFLAVDVEVDTDEVDAVTQSSEYARHSNATAFVVPYLGHNFGVGEEAGSILETLAETHGDRLVFVHEADVTSAMIRSARVRWALRIETYETEGELVDTLRRFAAGIMHRERRGELDQLE